MTAHVSARPLLVLHAVRLLGFGDTGRVAARFALARAETDELLLDFEACGWVTRVAFAGDSGWTLTDAGRAQGERLLAAELAECDAADTVARAHAGFLPLNAQVQEAVTAWQVRPMPGEPMAPNDHTDHRWDDRALDTLASVGRRLTPLATDLAELLERFDGYAARYSRALTRVEAGEPRWVDGPGIDSCHAVWFQLHEDLLATRGIERGSE